MHDFFLYTLLVHVNACMGAEKNPEPGTNNGICISVRSMSLPVYIYKLHSDENKYSSI